MKNRHRPDVLLFHTPAQQTAYGWQSASYPLGCGYFGASVYGGPCAELIGISENTLWTTSTPWINNRLCAGNESMCDIVFTCPLTDGEVTDYRRTLTLDNAIATVSFTRKSDGVVFRREYFTSYPDRVLAVRVSASVPGALESTVSLRPSNCRDWLFFKGDRGGKTATLDTTPGRIVMQGKGEYYDLGFAGILSLTAEGKNAQVTCDGHHRLCVSGADSFVLLFTVATSYVLDPQIFCENDPQKKLQGTARDPMAAAAEIMRAAEAYTYEQLRCRHTEDFGGKYGRVSVDFGGTDKETATDALRREYLFGTPDNRLPELVYQFGRYLMLSCSRPGGLPSSLQGIWNTYLIAPWTSGYWYNINEQMNYWPTFSAALPECFTPFADFNRARMPAMENCASGYISAHFPDRHEAGQGRDGWIVGTGNSSYSVGAPGGHSGPGTGGFTTLLYWDWYLYTGDRELLRREVFPLLQGMARFYSKCVQNTDGLYLTPISSSPEQKQQGTGAYVQAVGCAFDQQMICENNRHYLEACDLLEGDDIVDTALRDEIRAQIALYDPVIIGASGQIKEYREENAYGEIGDPFHRHISHLLGVAPGSIVTSDTPAWQDAARVSLHRRGNIAGGWGLANRALVWARLGEGGEAKHCFDLLVRNCLFDNLWSNHDGGYEYQIDANFGICAAIGEMLLQSDENTITVLPALPSEWSAHGRFSGLWARGGFTVDAAWEKGVPTEVRILSRLGRDCTLLSCFPEQLTVTDGEGNPVPVAFDIDRLTFATEPGGVYLIRGFVPARHAPAVTGFSVCDRDGTRLLSWDHPEPGRAGRFDILCACDSEPVYTAVASDLHGTSWSCPTPEGRRTYKVMWSPEDDGIPSVSATVTLG